LVETDQTTIRNQKGEISNNSSPLLPKRIEDHKVEKDSWGLHEWSGLWTREFVKRNEREGE